MIVINVAISDAVSVSLPVVEDVEGADGRYVIAPGENFAEMLKPGQKCRVIAGTSPALSCVKQGTIREIERKNSHIAILI
jgi:hypothetical protein